MIGGIFLEIPFGEVYKQNTVLSIRKNINRLFGLPSNYLTKGNLDKEIVNQILRIGKEDISRHLGSIRREYQHRSSDLIRSTVLGVFKDGKWSGDYYRFDSKQAQEAPPIRPHDWDLDQRAVEFLSDYKLHYQGSRFTAVIAATAPYAVRVEANNWNVDRYPGYALAVLKYGISRIAGALIKARPDAMNGKAMYGYIFESTGGSQTLKNF
jgi:hypothetical protein